MIKDEKIWIANTESGENVFIHPKMANRHGLIAGATGTGKTVTLKVLCESFSSMGVPVFIADVKGDVSGLLQAGTSSPDMDSRIKKFALDTEGFNFTSFPVALWDLSGKKGIKLRTTVSEMGPLLLSRIMKLNELQSDLLTICFQIADDNDLLMVDTKDLKAVLNYMNENSKDLAAEYGNISSQSIAAIVRAVVALEIAGGKTFFGEPSLKIEDWFATDGDGRGVINILDSSSLINDTRLYSTFLLWMLSELFENLPEVGDAEKPKMVFFFDEAHLLFNDAPKALLEKIEQVVKLVRSKGIGVYFCTQNPRDITDGVLSQLGNKIQHCLHAYTPADQKALKAAAQSFRTNPQFNTEEVIQNLGIGEAIVSFLDEKGVPGVCQKVNILPPQSKIGPADAIPRDSCMRSNSLCQKYKADVDPLSAYERLSEAKKQQEEASAKTSGSTSGSAKKSGSSKSQLSKSGKRATSSMGSSLGREVGKALGGNFGSLGKKIGGNIGASLGRGLLNTLFKM
ncbi:MAG: DUF853 family protein [Treponema sp.]|nr:DUF853 family protein [Treponema sp.]